MITTPRRHGSQPDARNLELVTYILCTMSHLATWQGKPRVGIDHALAARAWGREVDNPLARAYAADVSARAFAADGQAALCDEALDEEQAALATYHPDQPAPGWWYFYDASFNLGTRAECALQLGRPDQAWDTAAEALRLIDGTNLHNYALTLSFQGEARIAQGNITEATAILGDVARLTAAGRAARLTQRLLRLRQALAPWERSRAVHRLDERLAAYGVDGSGNTNKSYAE